jgi:cyclin-dependent kinase-like
MQNKYEIISVIGEGSYGIVYKCKNKTTGEFVAIKKLKESSEGSFYKIISRELKSLKILRHINIVNLKESFKKSGIYYLVFEFMDKNLLELLNLNPTGLDPNLIRHIIYQICKGLKFIHKNNFIHRDVKLENILIDKNNNVKICDFGFTREYNTGGLYTEYVATRWYRAPELLMSQSKYGVEVDFWGVGCIMGELIDGNPIFPGESDAEQLILIYKILGEKSFSETQIEYLKKNNIFEILEKVTKTKYFNPVNKSDIYVNVDIEKRYSSKLTKEGLNFLTRLLDPKPETRMKGDEIFRHPYFSSYIDVFTKYDAICLSTATNNQTLGNSNSFDKNNITNEKIENKSKKILENLMQTSQINFQPIKIKEKEDFTPERKDYNGNKLYNTGMKKKIPTINSIDIKKKNPLKLIHTSTNNSNAHSKDKIQNKLTQINFNHKIINNNENNSGYKKINNVNSLIDFQNQSNDLKNRRRENKFCTTQFPNSRNEDKEKNHLKFNFNSNEGNSNSNNVSTHLNNLNNLNHLNLNMNNSNLFTFYDEDMLRKSKMFFSPPSKNLTNNTITKYFTKNLKSDKNLNTGSSNNNSDNNMLKSTIRSPVVEKISTPMIIGTENEIENLNKKMHIRNASNNNSMYYIETSIQQQKNLSPSQVSQINFKKFNHNNSNNNNFNEKLKYSNSQANLIKTNLNFLPQLVIKKTNLK